MLVQPVAVALLPANVAVLDRHMADAGNLLGCDVRWGIRESRTRRFSGFRKDDKGRGPARPGDPLEPENGALAELTCVKADTCVLLFEYQRA